MTKQQEMQKYFDRAMVGMIKQGKPSMNSDGSCKYNAPDGSHCAIGLLQPPGVKFPEIGIRRLINDNDPSIPNRWHRIDTEFFVDMQKAHDGAASATYGDNERFINSFKYRMKIIANYHKLEWKYD